MLLHLTNLQLSDAFLMCSAACLWASKLAKLRVCESRLYLEGRGLLDCQSLRGLVLRNCQVNAAQIGDTLLLMADSQALFLLPCQP